MKSYFYLFTLLTVTFISLTSCADGSSYDRSQRAYESADEEALEMETLSANNISGEINDNSFVSSSAAAVSDDTLRKLIRTAHMKFRVENVRHASLEIENIIRKFDGFVSFTDLESEIDRKEIIPVSADSSLETIYYTVHNELRFRVPVANLDTTLRTIAQLIDFLDYRRIQAEDVTFSLLLNKMAEKRLGKHASRIEKAIDQQGEKLKHTTAAEDVLLSREEMLDQSKVRTLEIFDEIAFSTVTLNFYQRQAFKRTIIENDKNIEAYKPGFWSEVKDALYTGWYILKSIFIALFSIWPLLVLLGTAYFVYVRFIKNKNKS